MEGEPSPCWLQLPPAPSTARMLAASCPCHAGVRNCLLSRSELPCHLQSWPNPFMTVYVPLSAPFHRAMPGAPITWFPGTKDNRLPGTIVSNSTRDDCRAKPISSKVVTVSWNKYCCSNIAAVMEVCCFCLFYIHLTFSSNETTSSLHPSQSIYMT